jgi:hypothetical protein
VCADRVFWHFLDLFELDSPFADFSAFNLSVENYLMKASPDVMIHLEGCLSAMLQRWRDPKLFHVTLVSPDPELESDSPCHVYMGLPCFPL